MKFVHITFRFEYSDEIEQILDRNGVENYVRYQMQEGKDRDGKHYGTQVFPGSTTVVQARLSDEGVDALFSDLKDFRQRKDAHRHLEALAMPVERLLGQAD